MYRIPRFVISGPHRSAGKTTVTFGLINALTRRGLIVQPFKKGPDYIDPMWIGAAADRDCRNLDFHMMGDENILKSLQTFSEDADIAVIEGNQGLFDGLDLYGADSTAGLASLIEAPVVFVVDTSRMNRGVAAMLSGFVNFEPKVNFAGLILNKVGGPRHESKLIKAIEHYIGVDILGVLPKMPDEIGVTERHLGLVPVKEDPELVKKISIMGDAVEKNCDLDKILAIAKSAGELPQVQPCHLPEGSNNVKIAVAMDRAFTFYYPENLEALKSAGATILPFSPLTDKKLPEGANGIYIGGGFPEVFMAELEANISLRDEIRQRAESGTPIYAECGGLMYLTRSIEWKGAMRKMVGALPCDVVMTKKPMGLGYMRVEPTEENSWVSGKEAVNCHEFHHSKIENLPTDIKFGWRVTRGTGIVNGYDGLIHKNIFASYAHLHHCGAPKWAKGFVERVRGS